MSRCGRMIYVPKDVIIRLDEIMVREGITKRRVAWGKLAFLSGVGLNVEDNITLPPLFDLGGVNKKNRGKK